MQKLTEGYGLIEGPVWDDDRGLIFSDVLFGGVYAVDSSGEVATVLEHRRGIGGMSSHASGAGMIVSGRNVAFKPFGEGETIELLAQTAGAGFNDMTTDSSGRIYVGELGSNPLIDAERTPGVLWLIDIDGSSQVVGHDVLVTNGLGFSPDERTLYHSDSERRAVMCYDVHDDGTLGEKRLFAKTGRGVPDGLVVSEDGAVWVALAAGGGGVEVFNADGSTRTRLDIAEPMCTSVCFGGPDLRQLYIVSGSEGSDSDRAGSVWVTDCDVAGIPVTPAAIALAT